MDSSNNENTEKSRSPKILILLGLIVACCAFLPVLSAISSASQAVGPASSASNSGNSRPQSQLPRPTPTPDLSFSPIRLSGRGDDVVSLNKPDVPALVRIRHTGSSNFALWNYDAGGNRIDLLVNEIGSYTGTKPIDLRSDERTARFEVSADGAWTLEVVPITSATTLRVPGRATGSGADVLFLLGAEPDTATISHRGDSNFAVWSYGRRADLLVNEIGTYSGTVILSGDALLLEIEADGSWTIDIDS